MHLVDVIGQAVPTDALAAVRAEGLGRAGADGFGFGEKGDNAIVLAWLMLANVRHDLERGSTAIVASPSERLPRTGSKARDPGVQQRSAPNQ